MSSRCIPKIIDFINKLFVLQKNCNIIILTQNYMHMKKLSFLLFVSLFAAGIFISCNSGADTKAAADSSKMKADTPKAAMDTLNKDSVKGKPIIPPNN